MIRIISILPEDRVIDMRTNRQRLQDKTVNESKVYGVDWKPDVKTGSLSTVTWSSNPSGLTFSGETISGTQSLVTIAGGSENTEYAVTAKATKANAEVLEAVVWLRVTPSDRVT